MANAAQQDSRQPPSVNDVLDVLGHLGSALTAADARYQAAPASAAVATLMEDIYGACAAVLDLDGLLGCAVSR